jgi:hypothetical protein
VLSGSRGRRAEAEEKEEVGRVWKKKIGLYKQDVVRLVERNRPISYKPDLKKERMVIEMEVDKA